MKDIEEKPGRRHFLKVSSIGTVSLAAGGLLGLIISFIIDLIYDWEGNVDLKNVN